jgi:hypothetical protein
MSHRFGTMLWAAAFILFLTVVSANSKFAAADRRMLQLDAPCTKQCGSSFKFPTMGPNTYSCKACGFKSQSDCVRRSTCKTIWAGLKRINDYSGQPDLNAALYDYCMILGCYLLGD